MVAISMKEVESIRSSFLSKPCVTRRIKKQDNMLIRIIILIQTNLESKPGPSLKQICNLGHACFNFLSTNSDCNMQLLEL
jgi:hypothetical protein